jgi:GTP diphosphokinase / guanosine-3',5'-bis(diphosphate) 3'-diphosphatase
MNEWFQVLKAADAAARWHVHQRRKGAAQEPYINHLIEVAMLAADATGGVDSNLVMAALLHDAIEDCKVPKRLIAEIFGDDVASLVDEVTDDKNLPKEVRKRKQVETSPKKSPRGKILKLADKTSNLRAIAASPPATWSIDRRKEYVEWSREVVRGLRGISQRLEDEFDQAGAAAERSFKSMTGAQVKTSSSPQRPRTFAKKPPAVQRAFAKAMITAGLRGGDKALVKLGRDLMQRASNSDCAASSSSPSDVSVEQIKNTTGEQPRGDQLRPPAGDNGE